MGSCYSPLCLVCSPNLRSAALRTEDDHLRVAPAPQTSVTGGGTGIGRAIAIALAREGYRVAVAGRRRAPLEETVSLLGGGVAIAGDHSVETDAERMVSETESAFGSLNVLVNYAGAIRRNDRVHEVTTRALGRAGGGQPAGGSSSRAPRRGKGTTERGGLKRPATRPRLFQPRSGEPLAVGAGLQVGSPVDLKFPARSFEATGTAGDHRMLLVSRDVRV